MCKWNKIVSEICDTNVIITCLKILVGIVQLVYSTYLLSYCIQNLSEHHFLHFCMYYKIHLCLIDKETTLFLPSSAVQQIRHDGVFISKDNYMKIWYLC